MNRGRCVSPTTLTHGTRGISDWTNWGGYPPPIRGLINLWLEKKAPPPHCQHGCFAFGAVKKMAAARSSTPPPPPTSPPLSPKNYPCVQNTPTNIPSTTAATMLVTNPPSPSPHQIGTLVLGGWTRGDRSDTGAEAAQEVNGRRGDGVQPEPTGPTILHRPFWIVFEADFPGRRNDCITRG